MRVLPTTTMESMDELHKEGRKEKLGGGVDWGRGMEGFVGVREKGRLRMGLGGVRRKRKEKEKEVRRRRKGIVGAKKGCG